MKCGCPILMKLLYISGMEPDHAHRRRRVGTAFRIGLWLAAVLPGCAVDLLVGTGASSLPDSADTETASDTADVPDTSSASDTGYSPQCDEAVEIVVASLFPTDTQEVVCEWAIPDVLDETAIDYDHVNLIFGNGTGDGSGARRFIGYVASDSLCEEVLQGWYYDDPGQPRSLVACPQTCQLIRDGLNAPLRIELGCPTEAAALEGSGT
mgnify:CR=1 FL=1